MKRRRYFRIAVFSRIFNFKYALFPILFIIFLMFFNFGPFVFGEEERPRRPQNNNPNRNQQNGFFGEIGNFLQQQFMNPLFHPAQDQRQQRRQDQPRPSFHRQNSKKEKPQPKKEQKSNVPPGENTGLYWKQRANEEFKLGRLETALSFYDKAIQLNNTQSIFFSNRARCLKKMGRLQAALKDAQQSIELDNQNIKGHLLCGQILAQIGKMNKDLKKVSTAITRLTKALTLCVGQNKKSQFQDQISLYIYRGKKLLWYLKFEQVKEKRISAINQYKGYLQKDQKLQKQNAQNKLKEFISASDESIIFQIPDYLTCRITLDLMEEPVVTDSGQVYEKSAIQQHIQRNGKTDPFTRKPISGTLYPCIAIKKAIEDFLQKNPWAYQFSQGQTYEDIHF